METTAAFLDFVIGVACDRIAPPANTENAPTANITDPADFLRAFFAALDTVPITRTGTEYAADTVFVHPDIRAFLATPAATTDFRTEIQHTILPRSRLLLRDHWNYIIGPAWDEHTAIARLAAST